MKNKTSEVRLEIKSRLLSLQKEKGKVSDVQAVLNTFEYRDKSNRPETGRVAMLTTMPAKPLEVVGKQMKWSQAWAIDIFVEWESDSEEVLDQMKLELASVLVSKIQGVQRQEIESLEISYPANGSGGGVLSAEIITEYVESFS